MPRPLAVVIEETLKIWMGDSEEEAEETNRAWPHAAEIAELGRQALLVAHDPFAAERLLNKAYDLVAPGGNSICPTLYAQGWLECVNQAYDEAGDIDPDFAPYDPEYLYPVSPAIRV